MYIGTMLLPSYINSTCKINIKHSLRVFASVNLNESSSCVSLNAEVFIDFSSFVLIFELSFINQKMRLKC